MDRSKWFFHPILIFSFSTLALVASLFLYIYWYIEVSAGLKSVIDRFNLDPGQVLASQTWMVVLVLSILVGIILAGIFTIFVYYQKVLQLYRLQRNFIGNFTHELKTPVTSLSLYLETFQKHELSRPDQLKYIRYMLSDVGRLSENIGSILHLARIEGKSHANELVPVDIVETVERFLSNNSHLFDRCRIGIENRPESPIELLINPPLFEMLLMNLVTNAIKYNASPEPRIDIRFMPGKRILQIAFTDNGIGFAKREAKRIFKKFYQIGKTEDMSARGSGLGLYFVQSIARIHRGKVVAASEGAGKGAVFTLQLPLWGSGLPISKEPGI